MDFQGSYRKYFVERAFERRDLLQKITDKYAITSILYPGSYTHVTPSFYIPHAVYVDSDASAKKIFENMEPILKYIEENKTYSQSPKVRFYGQSYAKPLPIEDSFDMLFSQYAGPISQECKKYLKKGGILVANNSHADAGLAWLDPDYELIAVSNNNGAKASLSEKNLNEYFIPKKKEVTLQELLQSGKGIGYTKVASNYVFRRIV